MRILLVTVVLLASLAGGVFAETALTSISGCRRVEAPWADGDSFPVQLPDGRQITVRLYGADCLETRLSDESDARRLRAQRRYFGIGGGEAPESIARARDFGALAARRTSELLSSPFTLHTAFSDARGSSESKRVYGFVTTADGRDLASILVEEGLARAFGVVRQTPLALSSGDYRERLRDLELVAAVSRKGIWVSTDWKRLAEDRARERREAAELAQILRPSVPSGGLDINTAGVEELVALDGVGPSLAKNIVRARESAPFRSFDDLARVKGVGPGVMKKLTGSVRFGSVEKPGPP
jgi:competence protein ComEA